MSLTQLYTRADVIRWLTNREVQKGIAYLNVVSQLRVLSDSITAQVKGSARQPYHVSIDFFQDDAGELDIETECTCPVGYGCKHSAAVLLEALEMRNAAPQINPAVLQWIESFRRTATVKKKAVLSPVKRTEQLFYLLRLNIYSNMYEIYIQKGRAGEGGRPHHSAQGWNNIERALLQPPKFVDEEDIAILRALWAMRSKSRYADTFPITGRMGEDTLHRLLAANRLFFATKLENRYEYVASAALKLGAERQGRLKWQAADNGEIVPTILASPPATTILALETVWYVDAQTEEVGPLATSCSAEEISRLMTLPPLRAVDVAVVSNVLRELAPALTLPDNMAALRTVESAPRPVLTLDTAAPNWISNFRGYSYGSHEIDYAAPSFRYEEFVVEAGSTTEFVTAASGETVHIKRQAIAEASLLKSLELFDLKKMPPHALPTFQRAKWLYALNDKDAWPEFMQLTLPKLRERGWEMNIPANFRHLVLEISAWDADISEDESGWFNLDMGIMVDGERLPLAPLLYELFHRDPRWLDAKLLAQIGDQENITLLLPNGSRVLAPAERLKTLALTLIDLFDRPPEGELRLSKLDAPRLAELSNMENWQFKGAESVCRLAEKLKQKPGVLAVAPPVGFALQLRPYQQEGLAWLQYLREQELAGILADDMGLGKTAQALAHLLLEKEAGRLNKPALIVMPTSLIFNWKHEAARFAPGLKILSLHGKDRAENFPKILAHDVVLTTYPLLWRDEESIAVHEYHLLILDEAQTVKNAASKSAQTVRRLKARHRLCLTGTPLENHLGELWAQFDFLLPGFLGDSKGFTKAWRTPIEKHGDSLRRDLLARRIKPFILRRRKEDVAKELPPKTIIVRSVELEGGQRDLYEAVRSAMDQRVREEIASKGFARSHIVILDALLKLRQVCCDPRLLKNDAAKRVKERAKLDLLMEMLPELVSEGRRVLVFSQFTSMLDLIEAELVRHKLGYVLLTGDTKDRESVVGRFQREEVPIFLISLKAGGVGLNLTAADTVIHYDPWWNPAAENQATDRAHRIGQKSNVFVYKLVVAGSIEEKILALQEKKADLAAGVLSEDANGLAKFGAADLSALLEPLPSLEKK
ncbi:MAG: DEAD/DEAH box helicase family protein [Methylophilaceae bacterium]|nr:DEAD/DEAH box helicase family protein [Methylophilaceae bacterium]